MRFFIGFIFNFAALTSTGKSAFVNTQHKAQKIIGGDVARSGQFPFMASITVETEDSTHFCGGALITNQWLLTSGNCVHKAVTVTVRLGSNKLEGSDSSLITVSTSHTVLHPEFNPATFENDIGLVKLRLPVQLTSYIQPINLATVNLPVSAVPTAIGWGQTSDDDPELASELNFVKLVVLSNEECRITYGNQITETMVCAEGNYNEGSCIGDSGGPLIASLIGGLFVQHVGVSSFYSGNGCESTDPSGYTRTYPYVEWIKNVTTGD